MQLFPRFESPFDLPWTFSFVIRKLQQIDSLYELPKEKRPPDRILWWGTPEDLEDWLEKVLPSSRNKRSSGDNYIIVEEDNIE